MEMSHSAKKYDVFISFRGEDTRANFTSHLHSALSREGIKAYKDDECLEKGEDVWPALSNAIEDSQAAIVVFSKNYASSTWCLEELLKILECRKREGQVVIPVFCQVDPSDIRKQRGTYGEAFARYEQQVLSDKDKEYVQKKLPKWKAALTEAANVSGWDTDKDKDGTQVIQKIVEDVLKKLMFRFPDELTVKGLVGVGKICKEVEKLLFSKKKSGKVQVIGIWGMGGIGKTTIAKALFSKLFPKYDSVCFMENVREASQNIGQSKLTSLREKLLSELLKDEHLNSMSFRFIARRLSSKKVLVVLDDVSTLDQLDILCRECSNAGQGSKVIITTRDKHLLKGSRIVADHDIYEVKEWSFDKSLKLLCLNAFDNKRPNKGYEDLAKRAVNYAGGVPLALKVLGSNLCGRNIEFWGSELDKIKNHPDDAIQNVLQVSYDGLDIVQKKIFLDIAFFFKEEKMDFVTKILNACGFCAASGLEVLKDKALITISADKRIQMHDLIQDMGLNIVRRGIENPGKRSRLKDVEEVSDVLECKKKGRDAVEGIKLDLSQIDDLRLNAKAFSRMTDLRYLQFYIPSGKTPGNMDYPAILENFSAKLRYLEWNGYHLKSLPEAFVTKMLVEIRMPHSHITELWHEIKNVENLEGIDLSECKHLKILPDLSRACKLKWVNLSGCESLVELHPSILSLDALETLILDGCKRLKGLKGKSHLRSLEKISVNGCTSLTEFSLWSDSMISLDLNNAGIKKLNKSIGRSRNLCTLNLEGLGIQNLPDELSFLKQLEELRISNCKLLVLDRHKLHVLFNGLRSLHLLHLKDCCNMSELPNNIGDLDDLWELRLDGSSVETLPARIKYLTNLEVLSLRDCMNLKSLPELPTSIKELYAVNCKSLVTVSSLKTFARVMIGKTKHISFENCMKLDEPSLCRIMEDAKLTAVDAIIENGSVRDLVTRLIGYYSYNFVKVCSPGSSVPEEFMYRTTESSFTIVLPAHSNVLGLILCAVLSPSNEMKNDGARIFCQYYDGKGRKVGHASRWYHEPIRDLKCDHVYIWQDTHHFDNTARGYEHHVAVEFYVTDDLGRRDVLKIGIKECGVHLIFDSLRERDSVSKSTMRKLAMKFGLELGSWGVGVEV